MSNELTNVAAMSLFVEDLAKTKTFYQDVFGVEVVFEDETSACVKFEHMYINLLLASEGPKLVSPDNVASPDSGHRFQLSFWVDDVDAVCAELEKKGVKILNGPVDQEWGMRTANFNDPAGHSWEVASNVAQGE